MEIEKKAIAVLGGGLVKEAEGRWRTTTFADSGDKFGLSGDRLRVEAASLLFRENPKLTVIALGGRGQFKDVPSVPTLAQVIKNELAELGVVAAKIITEENSGNSFQQLRELIKIIKQHKFSMVEVISSRHHLERLQAMLDYQPQLDYLKERQRVGQLKLLAAEDVLIERQPKIWQELIEKAYASKAMQDRLALEKHGVEQIKQGIYKFQ